MPAHGPQASGIARRSRARGAGRAGRGRRVFPGLRGTPAAHNCEELRTICRCGSKAMFNARTVGGEPVLEGEQVAIDGVAVSYESLCAGCYLRRSGGRLG